MPDPAYGTPPAEPLSASEQYRVNRMEYDQKIKAWMGAVTCAVLGIFAAVVMFIVAIWLPSWASSRLAWTGGIVLGTSVVSVFVLGAPGVKPAVPKPPATGPATRRCPTCQTNCPTCQARRARAGLR